MASSNSSNYKLNAAIEKLTCTGESTDRIAGPDQLLLLENFDLQSLGTSPIPKTVVKVLFTRSKFHFVQVELFYSSPESWKVA